MTAFLTAVAVLSCLGLVVLSILVYENARMESTVKRRLYHTYCLLILATVTDLTSVLLNGAPMWTVGIHTAVKCLDYILSPLVAVFFVRQILDKSRTFLSLYCLLAANALLEILSAFTGWTFYVDSVNYYHHGPLHFLYMAVYIICILWAVYRFYVYGKQFPRENQLSLYTIGFLICLGIALQELVDSSIRTCSLALNLGCILQFIHFSEFRQLRQDENIRETSSLLEQDPMTGLLSRFAYNQFLQLYSERIPSDEPLTVFSIDINGLKRANDIYGHTAGDELIRGAANCITTVLSPYGKCFRAGGDEFIAVLSVDANTASELNAALQTAAQKWKGSLIPGLNLACGSASGNEYPNSTLIELIKAADKRMYREKALYYQRSGVDRRADHDAYRAVCGSYTKFLRVDLAQDAFEVITVDEMELTPRKGFSEKISQWLQDFGLSEQVHPEDREHYLQCTELETLRSYFRSGGKRYAIRYRRKIGDTYRDVLMEMIPTEKYSDSNQMIFLFVKDIDPS